MNKILLTNLPKYSPRSWRPLANPMEHEKILGGLTQLERYELIVSNTYDSIHGCLKLIISEYHL